MGCGKANCSICGSWTSSLPIMNSVNLWECLDDMELVEKAQPSRASPRNRDRFTRSSVTCFTALILMLLSITLFLDRTLDQPAGWQRRPGHGIDAELRGSDQFKAGTTAAGGVAYHSDSSNLQYSSVLGSEAQTARAVAPQSSGQVPGANSGGALQGMGVTFRKGSRAMSELVVAHLHDTTTPAEFRLFLRTLHRSGVTSRADVVLLFPAGGHPDDHGNKQLMSALNAEEMSFWRMMVAQQSIAPTHNTKQSSKKPTKRTHNDSAFRRQANHTGSGSFVMPNSTITEFTLQASPPFRQMDNAAAPAAANPTSRDSKKSNIPTDSDRSAITNYSALNLPKVPICPFNFLAFWQSREEGIQGKGRRLRDRVMWNTNALYVHGSGSTDEEMRAAVKWGDWGSIAGFDMQDLERDDAIAGFIDSPPSQLRRWMCYKMLLGMVKRQYQNVLLTEVRGAFILGDVMSATRDPSFGSRVYLFSEDRIWSESYAPQEKVSTVNAASSSKALEKLRSDGDLEAAKSFPWSSPNGSDENGGKQLNFIEEVYGKEIWKKLEEEDKQRAVLGSGIIMGNMKSIQTLSNAMLTEIVRVAAILRKSRAPFHDQPLLNYVVQKSRVLNRKVSEKLSMLPNGDSSVHSLPGSKQKSLFLRDGGLLFQALQGFHHELVPEETREAAVARIYGDICSSQQPSLRVYEDCPPT